LMDIKGLARPALDRLTELRTAITESKLPQSWSADAFLSSPSVPS